MPLQDAAVRERHVAFKEAIERSHDVLKVAGGSTIPGGIIGGRKFSPEGAVGVDLNMDLFSVDHDYVETLELELTAGRNFSRDLASDADDAYLVNESAVSAFGFDSPLDQILVKQSRSGEDDARGRIVGVVRDFQFSSLRSSITPALISLNTDASRYLFVRIRPEGIAESLDFLEETWRAFTPTTPFEYFFLDETFDDIYRQEERLSRALLFSSALAIFVAGLGLFGLATFMAERRTREIGVRKAFGATPKHIVALLSREFVIVILVATVISWPIAYLAGQRWLANFAVRVGMDWWIFVSAAVVCGLIALLAVGIQSVRAALTRPTDALRYE